MDLFTELGFGSVPSLPNDETANQLIIAIDQQIQRIRETARAYTELPLSPENSEAKVHLYSEYQTLRGELWQMYAGQWGSKGVSDKLEARNSVLSLTLNQYLIDHIDHIEGIAKAPVFMNYLMAQ